jgi:hypothetical protein
VATFSHWLLPGLQAKPSAQALLVSHDSPHCPTAQRYGAHDFLLPSESIASVPSAEHVEPLTQREFKSQPLPGAQSASEAQLVLHAVASQTYEPHAIGSTVGHVPSPSQRAAGVASPSAHAAAAHTTLAPA